MYREDVGLFAKIIDIMLKIDKKEIFTIPNIITYIRVLMIPIICIAFFEGNRALAISLSIIFWLGDIVDGYLARKLGQITNLGKMLDPIVDKLFQFSFICCSALMYEHIFVLVGLQFVKEFILAFVAGFAMYRYDVHESSRWYGKANTGLLNTSILLLLFFPNMDSWLVFLIVTINSISLVASFILYLIYYLRLISKRKQQNNQNTEQSE